MYFGTAVRTLLPEFVAEDPLGIFAPNDQRDYNDGVVIEPPPLQPPDVIDLSQSSPVQASLVPVRGQGRRGRGNAPRKVNHFVCTIATFKQGGINLIPEFVNEDGTLDVRRFVEGPGQKPHFIVERLKEVGFFDTFCTAAYGQWEEGEEGLLHYQWCFRLGALYGTAPTRWSEAEARKKLDDCVQRIAHAGDVFYESSHTSVHDGRQLPEEKCRWTNAIRYCTDPVKRFRFEDVETKPFEWTKDGSSMRQQAVNADVNDVQVIQRAVTQGRSLEEVVVDFPMNRVGQVNQLYNIFLNAESNECRHKCGNQHCGKLCALAVQRDDVQINIVVQHKLLAEGIQFHGVDDEVFLETKQRLLNYKCQFRSVWFFGNGGTGKTTYASMIARCHSIWQTDSPNNWFEVVVNNGFFGTSLQAGQLARAECVVWNECSKVQYFGGLDNFKRTFECRTNDINLKHGNVKLSNSLNIVTTNPCPLTVFETGFSGCPDEAEYLAFVRRIQYVFRFRRPNDSDTRFYTLHKIALPLTIMETCTFPTYGNFVQQWSTRQAARNINGIMAQVPPYTYDLESVPAHQTKWKEFLNPYMEIHQRELAEEAANMRF